METNAPINIQIHYAISSAHRTIHVDGAIGGATPQGQLHVALFSERAPIPDFMQHEVAPGNTLGKIVSASPTPAVRRELEISAIMTIDVAKSLHAWLGEKIDDLTKQRANFETRRIPTNA